MPIPSDKRLPITLLVAVLLGVTMETPPPKRLYSVDIIVVPRIPERFAYKTGRCLPL